MSVWAAASSDQRALHAGQQRVEAVDLAAQPQPHVGGDLVVAAAAGVQPLAGVADQRRQPGLDVEVHVLELQLPLEAAGFDLVADLRHAALDVVEVGLGDDPLRGQHGGVRQAAGDVGLPQPLVEADAGGVALDEFAHRLAEQCRPGLLLVGQGIVGHGRGPWSAVQWGVRIIRRTMNRRGPPDTDFAPTASRPASLWPEATRPGEASSSSFAATRFDPIAEDRARLRAQAAAAFDVCHPALALRAVLLVQAVLALVALATAQTTGDWGARQAALAFGGVAATLLWLVAVCALRDALRRRGAAARAAVVLSLGGVAALLAWLPLWWAGLAAAAGGLRVAAVTLAGVGFAALVWAWLDLRARLWHPAQASARLAELQSRIRPHFLFNALNTALALVRADPDRAEAVLEDLAQLFRVALADAGASVALEEEIDLARRYLAIEQVRFGERLRVHWDIDADPRGRRRPRAAAGAAAAGRERGAPRRRARGRRRQRHRAGVAAARAGGRAGQQHRRQRARDARPRHGAAQRARAAAPAARRGGAMRRVARTGARRRDLPRPHRAAGALMRPAP